MKIYFLLISIYISTSIFGQNVELVTPKFNLEVNTYNYEMIDSISWSDLKEGLTKNDAICHCQYRLNKDSTFKLYSVDCVSDFKINEGTWKIKNKNTLVLTSKEGGKEFLLVKVFNCIFFIVPNEIENFKNDLEITLKKLKPSSSIDIFSRKIIYSLIHRYFCTITYTITAPSSALTKNGARPANISCSLLSSLVWGRSVSREAR